MQRHVWHWYPNFDSSRSRNGRNWTCPSCGWATELPPVRRWHECLTLGLGPPNCAPCFSSKPSIFSGGTGDDKLCTIPIWKGPRTCWNAQALIAKFQGPSPSAINFFRSFYLISTIFGHSKYMCRWCGPLAILPSFFPAPDLILPCSHPLALERPTVLWPPPALAVPSPAGEQ